MTRSKIVFALMLLVGLMAAGCSSTPLPPLFIMAAPTPVGGVAPAESQPAAQTVAMAPTPEPSPTATATATLEPTATPTSEPTATAVSATATPTKSATAQVATSAATRAPTRAAQAVKTVAPTATPTPEWPKTLVITEADIESAAAANTMPGLEITGLDVVFGSDKMTVSFAGLRYSLISLRNVTVEGHFTVSNCDVNFVADSIRPSNLATNSIPGFVNQALDQQLGAWCVQSLAIAPGQLVVQVQPK